MTNITNRLPQCSHRKHKNKLVAWAVDCEGSHYQGLSFRLCCADCGAEIKNKSLQEK